MRIGQIATMQVIKQAAKEDLTKRWLAKKLADLKIIPLPPHFKALMDSLMSN